MFEFLSIRQLLLDSADGRSRFFAERMVAATASDNSSSLAESRNSNTRLRALGTLRRAWRGAVETRSGASSCGVGASVSLTDEVLRAARVSTTRSADVPQVAQASVTSSRAVPRRVGASATSSRPVPRRVGASVTSSRAVPRRFGASVTSSRAVPSAVDARDADAGTHVRATSAQGQRGRSSGSRATSVHGCRTSGRVRATSVHRLRTSRPVPSDVRCTVAARPRGSERRPRTRIVAARQVLGDIPASTPHVRGVPSVEDAVLRLADASNASGDDPQRTSPREVPSARSRALVGFRAADAPRLWYALGSRSCMPPPTARRCRSRRIRTWSRGETCGGGGRSGGRPSSSVPCCSFCRRSFGFTFTRPVPLVGDGAAYGMRSRRPTTAVPPWPRKEDLAFWALWLPVLIWGAASLYRWSFRCPHCGLRCAVRPRRCGHCGIGVGTPRSGVVEAGKTGAIQNRPVPGSGVRVT